MIKLKTDARTPTLTPEQFASMRDALYVFLGGEALDYMGRIAINDLVSSETLDHNHDDLYAPIEHEHPFLPYNDIVIEYTNSTTITILAGGKFTDDLGAIHTVSEDTSLNTTTNLATGETLIANTWYNVYGGLNTDDELLFVLSAGEVLPSELAHGKNLGVGVSIYSDGTLKIRPFDILGKMYRYRTGWPLYVGTLPTSAILMDFSSFFPRNTWAILRISTGLFSIADDNLASLWISLDGISHICVVTGCIINSVYSGRGTYITSHFITGIARQAYIYSNLAVPNATINLQIFGL